MFIPGIAQIMIGHQQVLDSLEDNKQEVEPKEKSTITYTYSRMPTVKIEAKLTKHGKELLERKKL